MRTVALLALMASAAHADEGMWLFDNRATAVASELIVAALKTVYGADRLSRELTR
jgi:hypothetical protein